MGICYPMPCPMHMHTIHYDRVGTENRTSLDNPVILAVESFKVTSYTNFAFQMKRFSLPSNDFLLEFFGH